MKNWKLLQIFYRVLYILSDWLHVIGTRDETYKTPVDSRGGLPFSKAISNKATQTQKVANYLTMLIGCTDYPFTIPFIIAVYFNFHSTYLGFLRFKLSMTGLKIIKMGFSIKVFCQKRGFSWWLQRKNYCLPCFAVCSFPANCIIIFSPLWTRFG